MKNNKGISMITLVITIICIVIFLAIAYRSGTRYIEDSKNQERAALTSIMSSAVERRQNDKYVSVGSGEKLYYSGYHLASGDFENLYIKFENKSCIYEPGLWYVIDSQKAQNLGIADADKYLVNNIKDETEDKTNKYIAVVDYYTGQVELIKCDGEDILNILDDVSTYDDGSGCEHTYTVVSCTEPSVCTKCGAILSHALGHEYNLEEPTCTEDKKCIRCGYIAEKALGHEYSDEVSYNEEGHFNKCIRYDTCHAIGNFEKHTLGYVPASENEWVHEVYCYECGWAKPDEACTLAVRPKDTIHHVKYCTKCLKEEEIAHDLLKYRNIDKNKHMVYCDTCKSDLYEEDHFDIEAPYGICDKCDGVMDVSQKPNIDTLKMENSTTGAQDLYYAKKGDKIKITIKSSIILAGAPTIKLQDIVIKPEDIAQDVALTWIAEIDTSEYAFTDGLMNIEVSNIKSLWNISAANVYATTDNKYITYDQTKPVYIYVPEN